MTTLMYAIRLMQQHRHATALADLTAAHLAVTCLVWIAKPGLGRTERRRCSETLVRPCV